MSKSIRYLGMTGLLVKETNERLYVILDEPKVHVRRLPVAALGDIELTPEHPVGQIQRHLRQACKRHKQTIPEALICQQQ